MNQDRMTPEAIAEIEGLAEYACEDPDDMDRLASEAVPQMAAEIRRAWTENTRLARELGAAMEDLAHECYSCGNFRDNGGKCSLWGTKCRELGWKAFLGLGDAPPYEWQWRGVCPANTPAQGATDDARGGGEG